MAEYSTIMITVDCCLHNVTCSYIVPFSG